MINPETIDLSALPSIRLQDRVSLPEISCIYFALNAAGAVQYIGRSINLRQRWISHHRVEQLENIDNVSIAYLQVSDAELLPRIEEALIEWFNPPLNGLALPCESSVEIKSMIRWRLRVLMAEQNISNQKLSELSGLHRVTISKLKKSDDLKQISGDTLNRLCNALRCTPNDLIEFKPDEMEVIA